MLWTRICIMDLIRSIFQKFLGDLGYPLGVSWQLPNCPSNAHVFRDRTVPSFHFGSSLCSAQASSFLSSTCCYKPLLARKSLFSFVICWKSSSSSSFFVFFNGPFSVIYFYLSNLICEIHFEGRVLINKTPSNTDLLPKTTGYQHWSEFFLFLFLPS